MPGPSSTDVHSPERIPNLGTWVLAHCCRHVATPQVRFPPIADIRSSAILRCMRLNRRMLLTGCGAGLLCASRGGARNPAFPGWYADPEIRIFGDRYWIYPTYSADTGDVAPGTTFSPTQLAQRRAPGIWSPFLAQTFLDAFFFARSRHLDPPAADLDIKDVGWAAYAVWAHGRFRHDCAPVARGARRRC
jgi:hypothetical protein